MVCNHSRTIMSSIYFFFYFLVVIIILCNIGLYSGMILIKISKFLHLVKFTFLLLCLSGNFMHFANEDENRTAAMNPEDAYFKHRKLMMKGKWFFNFSLSLTLSLSLKCMNSWTGVCSKWDISISQSRYPSPGIPQYIVEIVNTCVTGCAPSNIHLSCGWFASARIVNPRTFKRLSYDNCLVNGGKPLKTSQSIRFTYANSFMYPLQFKSADFC